MWIPSGFNAFFCRFFPSNGERIFVFVTELKLPEELYKLDLTIDDLESQTDIVTDVDSWYPKFKKYHGDHFLEEDGASVNDLTKEQFSNRLTQFLFSPKGARYRMLFRFNDTLTCGQPSPEVQMFTMEFTHALFDGPKQQVPAMNRVKTIIRQANFSGGDGRVFPFSKGYAAWETDEVSFDSKETSQMDRLTFLFSRSFPKNFTATSPWRFVASSSPL